MKRFLATNGRHVVWTCEDDLIVTGSCPDHGTRITTTDHYHASQEVLRITQGHDLALYISKYLKNRNARRNNQC